MTNPFLPSTMSRADIGREEAVPTRGDVVSEDEYDAEEMEAVSYTHLTLPTICSV